MSWLLDTGPLVAFFDRRDRFHQWALDQWRRAPMPLLTCEGVLAEATYLLQQHARLNPARVLALIERGVVATRFQVSEHSGSLMRLLENTPTRTCSSPTPVWWMSEVTPNCRVFTLDRTDFGVYRRMGRRVIPLVAPAEA